MKMKPIVCIAFVLIFSVCQAQEAFKIRLTSSGLAYAGETAVKALTAAIPSLQIPDIDDGDIKATNFKITKFTPPTSQINLQEPSTFSWTLTNAGIDITAHVSACHKIFGKKLCASIDVEMEATGVNLQIAGTLGRKPADPQRPAFLTANCQTSIKDLTIKTEGGALGWIINLFSSIISSQVKPDIEKSLNDQLQKWILVNGNDKLATITVDHTIDSRYNLDYGLATDPAITAGYLELNMKGLVTCLADPKLVSPYPYTPLAMQILQDFRMVYVLISDKIVNDLLYFAHELNQTNFLITDDVPELSSLLKLHCGEGGTCIGAYIPNVDTLYAGVDAAEIFVTTTIPPTIRVNADGSAALDANITLDISAPSPNTTAPIMLATLSMKANLLGNIKNGSLVGHANITDMGLDVTESQFASFVPTALENNLMDNIKPVIERKVNQIFEAGMPIPTMRDATFSNLVIRLLERTVQVETDIIYILH